MHSKSDRPNPGVRFKFFLFQFRMILSILTCQIWDYIFNTYVSKFETVESFGTKSSYAKPKVTFKIPPCQIKMYAPKSLQVKSMST